MRLCVTGATGVVGQRLLGALRDAGVTDEVTVLSRDPLRASSKLGAIGAPPAQAFAWEPRGELAPAQALAGRDAVVHLAGERIDQRWSAKAKREGAAEAQGDEIGYAAGDTQEFRTLS